MKFDHSHEHRVEFTIRVDPALLRWGYRLLDLLGGKGDAEIAKDIAALAASEATLRAATKAAQSPTP